MMVDADSDGNVLLSPGVSPGPSNKEHGPSEARTHSHSTARDAGTSEGAGLNLDGSESDDDHIDDHAIPARSLSEEDQLEMRKVVRDSPEFSMAMDFLETFEAVLKLTTEFTINSLEHEIITADGTQAGALRDLHMELMKGVSPFSRLAPEKWTYGLCRLSRAYFAIDPESNPFHGTVRGREAHAYAGFSAEQRCLLLRALCDMRSERQDARDLIDMGQLTAKTQHKLHAADPDAGDSEPIIYEPDDFTRQPLGEDDEERQYWLNDLRPGGLRLCREILPTEDDAEAYLARALAAAARAKSGRKSGAKKVRKASGCIPEEDMGPGRWETIATTLEEVDETGKALQKSKHEQDRSLGELICSQVAQVRAEEAARAARREAETLKELRREAQLQAGRDRSLRQRKPVDYTFTDTFLSMNRAIQGCSVWGSTSRRTGSTREPAPRPEPRAHPSTRAGARTGPAADSDDFTAPAADVDGADVPGATAAAADPAAASADPAQAAMLHATAHAAGRPAAAASAPSLGAARQAIKECAPKSVPQRRRDLRMPTPPAAPQTQLTAADAVAEAACRGTVSLAQRRASSAQAATSAAEGTAAAALAELAAGRPSAFPAAPAGTALGIPTCAAAHPEGPSGLAAGVCGPIAAGGIVEGVAVLRDSNHTHVKAPVAMAPGASGADAVAAAAVGVRLPRDSGRRRPHMPVPMTAPVNGTSVPASLAHHAEALGGVLGSSLGGALGGALGGRGEENGEVFIGGWGCKKRRYTPPASDASAAKMLRQSSGRAMTLPSLAPDGPVGH